MDNDARSTNQRIGPLNQLRLHFHIPLLEDLTFPQRLPRLRRMTKHLAATRTRPQSLLGLGDMTAKDNRTRLRRQKRCKILDQRQLLLLIEEVEESRSVYG